MALQEKFIGIQSGPVGRPVEEIPGGLKSAAPGGYELISMGAGGKGQEPLGETWTGPDSSISLL